MANRSQITSTNNQLKKRLICGIVMPIAGNQEYSEEHWVEVKLTISEVIKSTGFVPRLVSDADDIGVIHSRIINNLFENPLVVCDVSSRNPNVMFELGMRLAFNKPTIIIKDEKTSFSFDTGVIEHIPYHSSLNIQKIKKFKTDLSKKMIGTFKASSKNDYSTFLQHFLSLKNFSVVSESDKKIELLNKQIEKLKTKSTNVSKPKIEKLPSKNKYSVIEPGYEPMPEEPDTEESAS